MVILVGFVYGPTFELFEEEAESFFFIYGLLKISFVTTWIFAILGYSRLLLNKPNSLLTYANESVYPFYILHQSITISFAYYMRFWEISVFAKFGLLIIVTFGGCYLLYEFLIKRINILRVLFGLKTQNK
jgi:hypothetical protein